MGLAQWPLRLTCDSARLVMSQHASASKQAATQAVAASRTAVTQQATASQGRRRDAERAPGQGMPRSPTPQQLAPLHARRAATGAGVGAGAQGQGETPEPECSRSRRSLSPTKTRLSSRRSPASPVAGRGRPFTGNMPGCGPVSTRRGWIGCRPGCLSGCRVRKGRARRSVLPRDNCRRLRVIRTPWCRILAASLFVVRRSRTGVVSGYDKEPGAVASLASDALPLPRLVLGAPAAATAGLADYQWQVLF